MLTLYYKPTCFFSRKVLDRAAALGISFELKNVATEVESMAELLNLGGKSTTPFLVDSSRSVQMYESENIIDYLEAHYGGKATEPRMFNGVRVHPSDETCESCQ